MNVLLCFLKVSLRHDVPFLVKLYIFVEKYKPH